MRQWTIEKPGQLTFDTVSRLNVRIVAGRLAVLASEGPPALEVADVGDFPLIVTHEEDGTLTVAYEDLTWNNILDWLRPTRRRATLTLTVPKDCPVSAGVVSASAVVAGFEARTSVKSVSGEIVLDGVSGETQADTVSGVVESRGLVGDLSFKSVSGELTVARGTPRRLKATTVSGRITADLELPPTGHVTLNSVSGEIVVRLPHTAQADITLRSTSGQISTGFSELARASQPGMRTLSGRIGGGMAAVSATSVSGAVTILKGEPA
ncbi:hypothetical protein GCM10010156_58480 [Planobispora rosea]|uniref:DUF4097 domain-containing protein n=1 Tax=Planobispora rosea TaxID=35762 RepID=A0A8J3WGS8_PLARO|nr:DUF4097 family beta strand repeat-containing protein [Planobispora rosea]GGS92471.1 hypothetical protein GCM10010156_58480 [Planobispora rosea]GIH87151.1 hypothetical protein Pro02_55590 [Planobispora rosea]